MKNNISNEYYLSPKSSSKPYERKIKLNQISPKNYFTEVDINNLEKDDKEIIQKLEKRVQSQTQIRYKEDDNIKEYNLTEILKKNQTENSYNFQNNFEYNSQEKNSKMKEYGQSHNSPDYNFTDINNDNENYSSQNQNDIRYVKKNYEIKYINGNNIEENSNELTKYNFKYKYKKFQKDERNIEYEDKEKEEGEQNFDEVSKEDKEKLDFLELKKKPGRIIHQSVMETYDDEGNRVVTTKTIKEFSQKTGGLRIKDIHHSKERKNMRDIRQIKLKIIIKKIKKEKLILAIKINLIIKKEIKYIFWLN